MTFIYLFFTAMLSAFVQSTTGFGYGILFMAISPFFLPYASSMVLNLSTSIFGNAVNVAKRRIHIQFKHIWVPIVFSTTATYLSIELTRNISVGVFRRVLGVVLFLLAIWFMFFSKRVRIKPTFLNGAVAGVISGVGTALFTISGPPVVVYYLSAIEDKEEYMATIQMYFFLNSAITLVIRYFNGTFPQIMPLEFCVAAAGMLIGVILGGRLYSKLDGDTIKKYIYCFLALSGLWITFGG